MNAFDSVVRPLLGEVRAGLGLDTDPIAACHRSGYPATIEAERFGGQAAGWSA